MLDNLRKCLSATGMNRLSTHKCAQFLGMLVEGMLMRSASCICRRVFQHGCQAARGGRRGPSRVLRCDRCERPGSAHPVRRDMGVLLRQGIDHKGGLGGHAGGWRRRRVDLDGPGQGYEKDPQDALEAGAIGDWFGSTPRRGSGSGQKGSDFFPLLIA